jgi:hypothetical protein
MIVRTPNSVVGTRDMMRRCHSIGPAVLAALFLLSVLCPGRSIPPGDAPRKAPAAAVYDPDPTHLWNRVHQALHVRLTTARGGEEWLMQPELRPAEPDELDPLLWHRSKYLLTGPDGAKRDALVKTAPHLGDFPRKTRHAQREAIAVLDEFLERGGDKLVHDPLRRALFQRDLWALFDALTDPAWHEFAEAKDRMESERRALAVRLAKALHRVALPAEQILSLPDNYAAAVGTRQFPPAFDPAQPGVPFLPPDLVQPDGPWVLLGDRAGGPVAQAHLHFFNGRSSFLSFLRLPGGRQATVQFLDKLREWARAGGRGTAPALPAGTQVALLREAILVTDRGRLIPTRLTESVQLRIYHDLGEVNQKPVEFRLRRQALLAGKGSGLTPADSREQERAFLLFMGANAGDGHAPILSSCRHCHGGASIFSVRGFAPRDRGGGYRDLAATKRDSEERAVVRWKYDRYSWGLLEGLTGPAQP